MNIKKATRRLTILACLFLWSCGDGEPSSENEGTHDADATTIDMSMDMETQDSEPACTFLNDGECDEPANCPLGSDESDCASACETPELYWRFGAACTHREPNLAESPLENALSKGSINQTGYFDRTVDAALGDGSGNRPRHYRLFVPAHYDPEKAWPLMIMMPGHRVDIYTLANYTHLEATAEANNFILAYAEQEWRASAFKWAWWTDWSWTNQPDTNPDVSFLRDLIDDIASGWSVDRQRVYGVGHSRGGAMAYIAAFELSDTFAALCSQSGFIEFGYDSHVTGWSGRRTPMMLVHGTVDTDVPVTRSDAMYNQMQNLGWTSTELVYKRLDNVAHRWQPWLNQEMWDFLSAHALEAEGVE